MTATINSVTVVATDRESGINGYAITTNNNRPNTTDFRTASVTNNLNQKITGLTENTTYYVWVKDVAGNISNSKTIKTSIDTPPDLTTANVTFTSNPSGWTNGDVVVTANTSVSGYTLQTSKNASSWSDTNTQTFSANGTMYARLISKSGTAGDYAEYSVTNIDKNKPIITDVTATINSITMRATDYESWINGYTITTSYNTPSISAFSGISTTNVFSKTLSGLTPNTTYYLWVKDQAGNISTGYAMKTADDTPPALTKANTTFEQNPTGWTNGSVTVTAKTTVSGYTIQTSKNASSWSNTSTQTFSANGTMYARLISSTGKAGDYTTYNITNIDKNKPTIIDVTSTTNSITFRATDYESGINKYIITTSNSTPYIGDFTTVSSTTVLDKTVYNLSSNTTYWIWVRDQAGNTSTAYAMKTADNAPPALTSSNVTFSQRPTGWTNQDVTVTVSTTETGYTLQTSQDLVDWTSTNKQIVETNGPVYARLVNSSGTAGDYATYNVTNIDKVAPGFSKNHVSILRRKDIPQGSVIFNKIVDEQSGISKVILYYKTESEDTYSTQTYMYNYPGSTTEHTFRFEAMFSSQYEEYYMYAEIYDAAGNIRRTCTASLDYEGNTNYADDTATY